MLLVDDERDNLEFLGLLLRQVGAEVSLVQSGPAALEILRNRDVTVLVSDLEMPGMNGLDLIRTIRAAPETAAIPAIALTAHVRADQANAALDAGYDLHVAKPVDIIQLATAIDALAGLRQDSRRDRVPE